MSLDALVRSGVALAETLTGSLQVMVGHERWIGQDALGAASYAVTVDRPALVEQVARLVRALDGREVMATTKITLLRPVAVDVRDRLTLANGTTPPILSAQGLVDPTTGVGFVTQVWCG